MRCFILSLSRGSQGHGSTAVSRQVGLGWEGSGVGSRAGRCWDKGWGLLGGHRAPGAPPGSPLARGTPGMGAPLPEPCPRRVPQP